MPLEDWTAEELLEELRRVRREAPVIVHRVAGDPEEAFRLARLGAAAYLSGPLEVAKLAACLEAVFAHRESQGLLRLAAGLNSEPWRQLLVGESQAMRDVVEVIRLVGARRCTVLITGETGTGKEVAARALHLAGPRGRKPMVSVNCSALPEHLLEAELFGHVRGAFTGAVQSRTGRFEQADGGTLFLDEIGDLPLELQAKLLRVLQEREFQRLGSSETIRVDVRVIAATNGDLVERVRQGRFREDLFYRLNVVPLTMPPLRERLSDVPLLVQHFLEKVCRLENLPLKRVEPETLRRLCAYSWPGNVRQLENAVEMAVALSGERTVLYPSDFPLPSAVESKPLRSAAAPLVSVPDDGLDYEATVGAFERELLEQALRKTGGNKKRAADMLRLKRTTLTAKLRSLAARAAGA
ncbi:MAG: sigma-54 dependent transcriptional regulator [Bryobacteraceae bacterium]|nr:sigma-54 dependent transcriptional regulator [Bryobacteraceae bacterium]